MYVIKNKILVEDVKDDNKEQEQTSSGLFIASANTPHITMTGIVRDFGADVSFLDETGEEIMYLKTAGVPFIRDGKNYRIIEDSEVLALMGDDHYDLQDFLPENQRESHKCTSCDSCEA